MPHLSDRQPITIEDFTGPAVVIGCSCTKPCNKYYHHQVDKFFSIDTNSAKLPDYIGDLTQLPKELFANRFELTLFECLPFYVYNVFETKEGITGFENALEMTTANGFLVIVGCPRAQYCRKSLFDRKLKYIEGKNESIVIIPKNQDLEITEVIQQLKKLNAVHGLYSNFIRDSEMDSLKFCEVSWETMPRNYLPNTKINDIWYSDRINESLYQPALQRLLTNINELQEYAKTLLSVGARAKGEMLLDLATELKNEVLTFDKLPTQQKCNELYPFANRFKKNLKQHDTLMC